LKTRIGFGDDGTIIEIFVVRIFPCPCLGQEPKARVVTKIVSFSGGDRLMFNQMDKFQRWVVSKDVVWANMIGFFGLTTL
jgi:hypothetical protein